MTVFPPLIPRSRTFSPGIYPYTATGSWNGQQVRVMTSNAVFGSVVRLSFLGITEAQMLSVYAHYVQQIGGFNSFTLPDDVWSGVSSAGDYIDTGNQWRYLEPPTVEDLPCGGHNLELVFESVTSQAASTAGMERTIMLSLAAGAAAAANGMTGTITLGLQADGVVTASTGLSEIITITLTSGTATGTGEAHGLTRTIQCILTPGVAEDEGAVSGLASTVAVSLAGGAASGNNADVLGMTSTITVSLMAGAATGRIARRYWRMDTFANTTLNADALDLTEIKFWSGATQLTGITATANFTTTNVNGTFTTSGQPANIADGTVGTTNRSYRTSWNATYRATAAINFDFGSAVSLTHVEVFSLYAQPRFPASFKLSSSSTNGSGYVDVATVTVGTSFSLVTTDVYTSGKVAIP